MDMPSGKTGTPPNSLSKKRRMAFRLVLIAFPFLLLALGELVMRHMVDTTKLSDDFLVNLVDIPSFFAVREIDGRPCYQVTHDEAYRDRNIVFPVQKEPNALRIFCLGGSASAGWPHPQTEIYSAYLQRALQRAYPGRTVEVINVSAHAYASYRVRLIFENVIHFDPDLIVMYSGNNEFIEKRTYIQRSRGFEVANQLANRSILFRMIRSRMLKRFQPPGTLSADRRQHVNYEQWSKVAQVTLELRKDPVQFNKVKEHYQFSMEAMLREARAQHVPVLFCTVPVNVRDWHPNVSYHARAGAELDQWSGVYEAGRRALLQADPEQAVRRLRQAAEMDPSYADGHFFLARALEAQGDWAAAEREYDRAKDLDYNPFRAISDLNAILRTIVAQHPGSSYLADLDGALRQASAPRAPGFDQFLDYVHPSQTGNVCIARTVFDAIVAHRLFGPPTGVDHFVYEPAPIDPEGHFYDETRDGKVQKTMLWVFGMMHQYDSMVQKARQLAEAGINCGAIQQAILEVFPAYLELERNQILGLPVDSAGEKSIREKVQRFYDEFYLKNGED